MNKAKVALPLYMLDTKLNKGNIRFVGQHYSSDVQVVDRAYDYRVIADRAFALRSALESK